jgi:hypothetical protein
VAPPQKDGAGPEDKPPPPDWAKIFTDLLCHTSAGPSDIPNMTIPQIDAIRSRLGENIAIKIGMPSLFGADTEISVPSDQPDKPPKLSEFMHYASVCNSVYK